MDVKNIDVVQSLNDMMWRFCLSTELWELYVGEKHDISFDDGIKIPFFDGDSAKLSEEVKKIPNDKGGIYIYVLENPIVPDTGRYIMYVGRALFTKTENLRARVRSHFYQYKRADENELLIRLYDNWAKYVYLIYIPMDEDNDTIGRIEDELIVTLTPPCNKKYPSVKIKKKLRAFQYS